ncbi:polysaccharide deacetylase family protein [Cyanobium sp. Cruz CV13-4-11]|nr:polysaccharide deacetylase family protein [Cyanobium sp. Cruz CV11-17]MCP9920210.1 polysaccharide deacetylase family protein [Cyanobium sp. Cruz CV13-4-11]
MMFSRLKELVCSLKPCGQVLLYHRVAPTLSDPQLLAVSPLCFAEQMAYIRRNAVPMALTDMVRAANEGTLPRRAVAVTFDDGYADNYHYAKPVLESAGVPATVFAVSSAVSAQTEFWWDAIERALLGQNGSLTLRLDLAGESRTWALSGDPGAFQDWTVLDPFDPTPRHTAYREIMPLVKPLTPSERSTVLTSIQNQTGVDTGPTDDRRPMTERELRSLVENGLIDVGAHTVSHPQLSGLTMEEQSVQVSASRRDLETLLGRQVTTFAYPYGTKVDYTAKSVDLVRHAGFTLACSNFPGQVLNRRVDAFEVPRYLVRESPLSTFRANFEARMHGAK